MSGFLIPSTTTLENFRLPTRLNRQNYLLKAKNGRLKFYCILLEYLQSFEYLILLKCSGEAACFQGIRGIFASWWGYSPPLAHRS